MPRLVKSSSLVPRQRQHRDPVVDPLKGVRDLLARNRLVRSARAALVPEPVQPEPEAEPLRERVLRVEPIQGDVPVPVQGEGSDSPIPGGDA